MKITEKKEVIKKQIERVIVGAKCDLCKKPIEKIDCHNYNYFVVHTWHNDWGNDSVDSHQYQDACSPECVMKMLKPYLEYAYKHPYNSMGVEVTHERSIEEYD